MRRMINLTHYNAVLFRDTLPGLVHRYEDSERIKELIQQLLKSPSDIITLNEVWANSIRDQIIQGVSVM